MVGSIFNRKGIPCKWCRRDPEYTDDYYRFQTGKVSNGQYTYLGKKWVRHPNGSTSVMIHLRHNSQRCNYHEEWFKAVNFLNNNTRCRVCRNLNTHEKQRWSNNYFLFRVFNRLDNIHGQYLPAEKYKGYRVNILWWHMTRHPHLFITTPDSFFTKCAKCPRCQSISQPEFYTWNWLNKHGFYQYKGNLQHGYVIKHGILKNYHIDFLINNHIAIEVQGGTHVVPWNHHKKAIGKLRQTKRRDINKKKYCPKYNINLFHIYAYKWVKDHYICTCSKELKNQIFKQLNTLLNRGDINNKD